MRIAEVEIYFDATNAAVMRHPDRRFPGVLIQGDTLHTLFVSADACRAALGRLDEDDRYELAELHERLKDLLGHYKAVLAEHQIPLPFSEDPDV